MKIGGKMRGIWTRGERTMTTREEALNFGLSFPNTYQSAPFHDENWQLVRVKGSKKVFLWTYERNGFINLNVKVKLSALRRQWFTYPRRILLCPNAIHCSTCQQQGHQRPTYPH